MTPILFALLFASPPTMAQDFFSLDSLLDDTAAPSATPPPASAAWPTASSIDQVYKTLSIDWAGQPDETLPFAAVTQIEHARAMGDAPEELFALLQDGRRVVLARGPQVVDQVRLLRTALANKIVELPAGIGHSEQPTGAPTPSLKITVAGALLSLGKLSSSAVTAPKKTGEATPKQVVRRVVKMHMDKIRGCYQRAAQEQPQLAGKVVVRFEVAANGQMGSS